MKTTHLLAISIITALINVCSVFLMVLLLMNNKTINAILSYFDDETINFILNTFFSVEMWKTFAFISMLTYSVAVVIRLKAGRRVDWILVVATLTLPVSLFFALA